jgi:hypothetical protein|tara:strand:- start:172 stop:795 length:624 start_codon:yes stop_codon:yes gene_type:complete
MNYSELVSQIKNFLEDDSTEFSDSIDEIIDQAEEMIFQRLPNLPAFRQSATGTLASGTSSYTISNARIIRNVGVTVSSNVTYLDHRVDSYLKDYWPNASTTGQPIMYSTDSATVSGTVITLAPTPNSNYSYEVEFAAPATGLSSGNTTSWLGANAENVLLSACLYEASAFLKAPETVTLYKSQFDEALQLMQQEMLRDYASEYNGGI